MDDDGSSYDHTRAYSDELCLTLKRKPIQTPDMLIDRNEYVKIKPYKMNQVYYRLPDGLVLGYSGLKIIFRHDYYISEYGHIYNRTTGRHVGGSIKQGFRGYDLTIKGPVRSVQVMQHMLVAQMFLKPQPGMSWVHHIDLNKYNNHYSNLMYCTQRGKLTIYLIIS